jgi:hypothetical protein
MQYAYGMRARGFSLGAQPKEGFVERIEDDSETYYDLIIYDRHLSENEIKNYELVYLGIMNED